MSIEHRCWRHAKGELCISLETCSRQHASILVSPGAAVEHGQIVSAHTQSMLGAVPQHVTLTNQGSPQHPPQHLPPPGCLQIPWQAQHLCCHACWETCKVANIEQWHNDQQAVLVHAQQHCTLKSCTISSSCMS